MDYQSLYAKTVVELRALAKELHVKVPAGTNKQRLAELLLEAAAADKAKEKPAREAPAAAEAVSAPEPAPKADEKARPVPAVSRPKGEIKPAMAPEAPVAPPPGQRTPKMRKSPANVPETPVASAAATPKPDAPVAPPSRQRTAGTRRNPGPADENQRRAANGASEKRIALRRPPEGFAANAAPLHRQGAPLAPKPQPAQAATGVGEPEGRANAAESKPVSPAELKRANAVEPKPVKPAVSELLASGEGGDGAGVLELQPDGYGFLRAENCLPGPNDVYISIAQIRRFNLRMGDYVEGKTRPQREGDRYSAIMYITKVNGLPPEEAANRPRFEDLVPVYPDQRLRLERPDGSLSLRLVDMLAPIGKGQRGMIVSPPKAGKTTLLKQIANAITAGYPDVHLIVLLIDERPEEVTDMQRSIDGEVVYSTFDEMPENHARVAEMVLARAQRLVEAGRDVVVLMDSITRLARAYNLVITPTGRSLSGGLDPGALFKPKRFFGAARNIENGGSLTIVATALVDTGSRMDDIIYEEFKGTGNMELHLDRKLSDRRVFPAIDMVRSGTRREELLLTESEQAGEMQVRRMLGSGKDPEMPEQIISLMTHTHSNEDFFQRLQGWIAVAEKDGFTRGR